MSVRCLIVDDEPLARRVIEKYLERLPAFELTGQCASAVEAAAFMQGQTVDLIFLDIQMPELTGLDFLKTLPHPPKVILTTAYSEYALEGYEYDVMDYLLKPIPFDRFLKAINRHPLLQLPQPSRTVETSPPDPTHLIIEADGQSHRLALREMDYLEGYGNFVKVWTTRGMLLTAGPLKRLEADLPSRRFVRVHKSFIVRLDAVQSVEGHLLRLKNKTLPVGRAYKLKLDEALKG